MKIIKKVILIFLDVIYLCYNIVIIIKLNLSYKIKKGNITWFMGCDYALIILIFLYIAYIVYIIVIYFQFGGNSITDRGEKYIFKKFRDFAINDYILPSNFKRMKEYEKKKCIVNNKDNYTIKNIEDLINQINELRMKKNIEILNWDKVIYFEDLIFDKYSESFLNDDENIFKLSNRKYLLKYPSDEFKKRFNNRDKNVINILLNVNVNKIIIVEKNSIIFIFLYDQITYNKYNNIIHIYTERCQNETSSKRSFIENYIYEDTY